MYLVDEIHYYKLFVENCKEMSGSGMYRECAQHREVLMQSIERATGTHRDERQENGYSTVQGSPNAQYTM